MGGNILSENGTGEVRKVIKNDHERRHTKVMQDKQDDDERIKKKDSNNLEGPVESNITGEIEMSVAYDEVTSGVENDINGCEEDWDVDESNQNDVDGIDEGELREASAYEEAISSVENNTTNDCDEDWNKDKNNPKQAGAELCQAQGKFRLARL